MLTSKVHFKKVWILLGIVVVFIVTGLLSFPNFHKRTGPSFIIIAAERLSFHSFSCSDDKSTLTSGLSSLCKEAIRFTHAYSTSSQPVASLASLLTGHYPIRHKLHRTSDRLDSNLQTMASLASKNDYRTAFYSGSPNILRKSGLYRGFEIFDDISLINYRNYNVPIEQLLNTSFNWMSSQNSPFVNIVHSSELDSLNQSETETSPFEKFDEQLSVFFTKLKENGLWEKNFVIVVGLNGHSDLNRPEETAFSNLHSENTNVIAFVKPPRQEGDEGVYWKVDTAINLADIGLSLMKTLDRSYLTLVDSTFPTKDFSSLWSSSPATEQLTAPRRILLESVNPWSKETEVRFAIHHKNLFHVENKHDELYNTLTDGLETNDISNSANSQQNDFMNENRKIFNDLRKNKNLKAWINFKSDYEEIVYLNRRYWLEVSQRTAWLEKELERFRETKVSQPLTGLAVVNSNIRFRNEVAKITKTTPFSISDRDRELYIQLLRLNSLNLALENSWQVWKPEVVWNQSNLIVEYQ